MNEFCSTLFRQVDDVLEALKESSFNVSNSPELECVIVFTSVKLLCLLSVRRAQLMEPTNPGRSKLLLPLQSSHLEESDDVLHCNAYMPNIFLSRINRKQMLKNQKCKVLMIFADRWVMEEETWRHFYFSLLSWKCHGNFKSVEVCEDSFHKKCILVGDRSDMFKVCSLTVWRYHWHILITALVEVGQADEPSPLQKKIS